MTIHHVGLINQVLALKYTVYSSHSHILYQATLDALPATLKLCEVKLQIEHVHSRNMQIFLRSFNACKRWYFGQFEKGIFLTQKVLFNHITHQKLSRLL